MAWTGWRAVLATVLAFAAPGLAFACDHGDADGPDVGLVLSGGGALASTHVGALKVIEELGVPIHCVVGTSMGSVVGGLYAAGYSADELETVFVSTDWPDVFAGAPPREDQSYLQSEREGEYLTGALVGFDANGVRLPGGIRSMRGLRRHFRDLTFHVPLSADFDDLAVPYRAVVTDFATGEAVALDEGDLVQSMLASMAVPGAFPAIEIDARFYVDGGMAAQLPVGLAQQMGADIIIALDTTVEPPAPDGAPNVANTLQQLVRVTVWRNHQQDVARLGPQDVLIAPALDGLSTTAFERASQGVEMGMREARRFEVQLRAIAARAAPDRQRSLPRTRPEDQADAPVRIVNNTHLHDSVLANRADVSRTLDGEGHHRLERRMNALTAFGALGAVDLAQDGQGLVLQVDERDLGRRLVQGGLRLSNNFEGDSTFSVLARYSQRPFSRHGGEFNLSMELGTTNALTASLQQPFGAAGRFFYEPGVYYQGVERPLNLAEFRLGEFWDQSGGVRLRVGRELGDWGLAELGGEVRRGRLEPQVTFLPDVEPVVYTLAGVTGAFAVDTLDQLSWPTRGVQALLQVSHLFDVDGEAADTSQVQFQARTAFESGDYAFIVSGRYGVVETQDDNPVEIVSIGGFRRLSAYPQDSIPTDRYGYGSVEVFKRLDQAGSLINLPVYAGILAETAYVEFDFLGLDEGGMVYSGAVYIGADTLLGPVILSTAVGEEGAGGVFLHVGRSF